MEKTYTISTLGCQMNEHDSEQISLILESIGYKKSNKTNQNLPVADVIVINTCSVRENAVNKLYGHLGQYQSYKNKFPYTTFIICGCVSEQEKNKIFTKSPVPDIIFGTNSINQLPKLLDKKLKGFKKISIFNNLNIKNEFNYNITNNNYKLSEYINISTGCNNLCSYCIVPFVRGKEIDRNPDDIYKEALKKVSNGTVEIILLGQNVNTYGVSFNDNKAFYKLLKKISNIKGLKRLRFESPHPSGFTNNIIDLMSDSKVIMPYLHMPLQSGSDKVLKNMRRSYNINKFLKIIDYAYNKINDVCISTDIIVGFPTETDLDFNKTIKIIKQCNFSNIYSFIYSPRPFTKSYNLKTLNKTQINDRFNTLLKLQNNISYKINKKDIGKVKKILIQQKIGKKDINNNKISGRTNNFKLVHFNNNNQNNIFYNIKITNASPNFLTGKII